MPSILHIVLRDIPALIMVATATWRSVSLGLPGEDSGESGHSLLEYDGSEIERPSRVGMST